MVSAWLVSVLAFANGEAVPSGDDDPMSIVGGTEATSCQFPSAVAILEDDGNPVMCSGTLVHPEVVTLAAHCIIPDRPIVAVGFGEDGEGDDPGPARTIAISECVAHPDYDNFGNPDIAYCILDEPVTDVPITPILAGCETDVLQPGTEVTIVGFGASWGSVDDEGNSIGTGAGIKRFVTQTIDTISNELDEVNMVGDNGSQSACFGDSGGPAFVQLGDGTWRVFGAASRLYDPGGFPPPIEEGNICGVGVTYGYLSTRLHWLESETARDVTPCHDDFGNWEGGPDCGAFPLTIGTGTGSWAIGCSGGALAGGEQLCEEWAPETTGGESSTGFPGESSGFPGETGTPGTTTSPIPPGTSSTTAPPPVTTTTTATSTSSDDSRGTEGDTDTDTDVALDGDGLASRGCACTTSKTAAPPLLLLLCALGRRRRRR